MQDMESNMSGAEHGSQAIYRALGVLQLFAPDRTRITLKQICDETGLTMPTAHRITKALAANQFLLQVPDRGTGTYALGPALLALALVILQQHDDEGVVAAALPHMTRLRELTGETVGLYRSVGTDRLCIAELTSRQPIRLATGIGHTYPLAMSASGRALLSVLPVEQIDEVLAATKQIHSGLSVAKVRKEILETARRGYTLTLEDTVLDASAVAVPIKANDGSAIASIGITGPSNRWTRANIESHAPELMAAAHAIERQLGHLHRLSPADAAVPDEPAAPRSSRSG
jgi:DNA-binding IclR family transcriptional regulator